MMNKPSIFTIHHSATLSGSLASFRREHKRKGFSDVAYHFVVGNGEGQLDGQALRGRRDEVVGAGVKKANSGKLHVCLVGNFETHEPTARQLDALGDVLRDWRGKHGNLPVRGHREVALARYPTACPGKNLDLAGVRRWVDFEVRQRVRVPLSQFLQVQLPTPVRAQIQVIPALRRDMVSRQFEPPALVIGGRTYVELRTVAAGMEWQPPTWDAAQRLVVVHTRQKQER